MILSLMLTSTLNLSCPETIIENKTSTWAEIDDRQLASSKDRCKKIYKNSPCLKRFIKVADRTYVAMCGVPDGEG